MADSRQISNPRHDRNGWLLISAALAVISSLAHVLHLVTHFNQSRPRTSSTTAGPEAAFPVRLQTLIGLSWILVLVPLISRRWRSPPDAILRPRIPAEPAPATAAIRPAPDDTLSETARMSHPPAVAAAITAPASVSFRHWETIRAWAVIGSALALAYTAQAVLDSRITDGMQIPLITDNFRSATDDNRVFMATALYAGAMLLFYQVRRLRSQPTPSHDGPAAVPSSFRLPIVGPLCSLVSIILYATQGESAAVRWLWAGGLILTIAGSIRRYGTGRHPASESSPAFTWVSAAVVLIIIAAGFWLRFVALANVPQDIHPDSAIIGIQARKYLTGEQQNIFGDSIRGLPSMMMVVYSIGMSLFGNNLYGLYLTEAIAGVLSLVGLYLLVWRLFDRHWIAALATAVTATNAVHLHFSRVSDIMLPTLCVMFALWLLIDGLKARSNTSLLLSGIMAAFATLGYNSGRIILPLMFFILIFVFVYRRQWIIDNWKGLSLLLIGLTITIGPNLVYFYQHQRDLSGRAWDVFLFNPRTLERAKIGLEVNTYADVIVEQAKRTLFGMHYYLNTSSHFYYTYPMLSSLLSPLFFLGLVRAVQQWRAPPHGLVLIAFGLIMATGGFLTAGAPSWPRILTALPFASVFIALALEDIGDRFQDAVSAGLRQSHRSALQAAAALAAIVALLLIVGRSQWTQYYQSVESDGLVPSRIGRYLAALPTDIAACDFRGEFRLDIFEVSFMAWPRQLIDIAPNDRESAVDTCPGPPVVWILYPEYGDRLQWVRDRWPNGIVEEHPNRDGRLGFISYLVK